MKSRPVHQTQIVQTEHSSQKHFGSMNTETVVSKAAQEKRFFLTTYHADWSICMLFFSQKKKTSDRAKKFSIALCTPAKMCICLVITWDLKWQVSSQCITISLVRERFIIHFRWSCIMFPTSSVDSLTCKMISVVHVLFSSVIYVAIAVRTRTRTVKKSCTVTISICCSDISLYN